MEKYLIINADDFGMCHSANAAVSELLKKGAITSATVMTPCPWAPEACRFAAANHGLAIGVHLTTTSEWKNYRWTPVSRGEVDSLLDSEGYMHHESDEFEKAADLEQTRRELIAQIQRAAVLGLSNPSHLDNHMGSLYGIETGRFEILQLAFDVAGEYKLPFRFPTEYLEGQFDNATLDIKINGELLDRLFEQFRQYAKAKGVATPDYLIPNEWNGPQNDSYENFREYMYELYRSFPEGVTETYSHPAMESEELKNISGVWHRRVWEYRFFNDPMTMQHIKACGIKLINYRDLAEMRK